MRCALAWISIALALAACGGRRDLAATSDSGAPGFQLDALPGGDDAGPIDLEAGPAYALLAVVPSHGPFNGGTRIELRGLGFSSYSTVRLGSVSVDATGVIASDPYHAQLTTPAGDPGSVDVTISDDRTGSISTLRAGFVFDDYYADPNNGSTVGGTKIVINGRGTKWIAGTKVDIDGKPCAELVIDGPERMHCTTPAGLPGSKGIDITTPDGTVDSVADAYTYSDTIDGYRGGLAGDVLPGELRVLTLNNQDGTFIGGATVVVRGSDGTEVRGTTNDAGIASFPTPPPPPLTVSTSKKCIQPATFDGVGVKDVTFYLDPVLSVACIPPDGQPPPTGGRVQDTGLIQGEIVFPGAVEFARAGFTGIPAPASPTQRQVAYVFVADSDPTSRFSLPDPTTGLTEATPGTIGYRFSLYSVPGNLTLYALAGIEDRPKGRPARFEPYVYGVTRGVGVVANTTVSRVLIRMDGTFGNTAKLAPSTIPASGRGPDRLRTTLAVDLGGGYMTLPNGFADAFLPIGGDQTFVGVPPLNGPLTISSYTVDMEAVTGGAGGAPMSVVRHQKFRVAGADVAVGPFVPLPKVLSPTAGAAWDGKTVQLDLPAGSVDVIVVNVGASDGSSGWTINAPGDTRLVHLPDFSASPELALPHGNLQISVSAAKLTGLRWGEVRYRQLSRGGWDAFSYDVTYGAW